MIEISDAEETEDIFKLMMAINFPKLINDQTKDLVNSGKVNTKKNSPKGFCKLNSTFLNSNGLKKKIYFKLIER